MVRRVLGGEKGSDNWYDRCETFWNSVRHALSRPGGVVTRTIHHLVFRSALRLSFRFRLCRSYVHHRRWQGPFRPPRCIPVLPMGAPGCRACSVVRCSCLCLPACRVPYRAVSCGSGGVRVGASVQFPEVRVAWLLLWCWGVPSGAAGWARRNTPVFAGRDRRACGSRTVSSWPLACSG